MDSEFDSAEGRKDRTKWIWLGVGVLFLAMVAAMWQWSNIDPRQSIAQVRHILIAYDASDPAAQDRAFKLITEIRKRILEGESFSRLAASYSNDPGSAEKGGYLGSVTKGSLVDEIDSYIWSAPIGQLSDVIKTRYGFHIVIVDYRKLSKAELALKVDEERLQKEIEKQKEQRQQKRP